MELNEATVLELADRLQGFATAWGGERADAHVSAKLQELRTRFTQDGIDLTPAEAVEQIEAQTRVQWDREAATAGVLLEVDRDVARALVEDRITAAGVLPATVDPLVSQQARQTEELIALLATRELREQCTGMTRTQALAWYEAADEAQQAGRRVVTFLEASWRTTTFQDDPEHDAIAIGRLQAAMAARQQKRVPAELLAWREKLARAGGAQFAETLAHLRSGRGIAKRPTRPTLRIA